MAKPLISGVPSARRPPGVRRLYMAATLLVTVLSLASACARSAPGDGPERDSTRISLAELEASRAANLYDLVERERPRWLLTRGMRSFRLPTEIVVAVDGRYHGDVETLRNFKPEVARELTYLDGTTATASITGLGSRHVEAGILIEMRRR